jgi:hypothetical protein
MKDVLIATGADKQAVALQDLEKKICSGAHGRS